MPRESPDGLVQMITSSQYFTASRWPIVGVGDFASRSHKDGHMGQHSLSQCRALLTALADSDFHSGKELARQLGSSRASVWKYVNQLRTIGIDVPYVRSRGYRLEFPVEFLDADRITAVLSQRGMPAVPLYILQSVDSTSVWLARSPRHAFPSGTFCFAEMQTAGRGSKGRSWVSPFARNLYLSVTWQFRGGPEKLLGLSLAVGVMIVEALEGCGFSDLGLKWPNDLGWRGRKLGGVLIELKGQGGDATWAVIGIGVNVFMPRGAMAGVEQGWCDLFEIRGGAVPRNHIAGALVATLTQGLRRFDGEGWEAFRARWESLDRCKGQQIRVIMSSGTEEGRALGVDGAGNLLVETSGGVRAYNSGDVSLRPLS